jgi:hypothetical protein
MHCVCKGDTYEFDPRGVFRRPVGGLVVLGQRVAANRLEASRALVICLAATLRHLVLGPPAEVEGS